MTRSLLAHPALPFILASLVSMFAACDDHSAPWQPVARADVTFLLPLDGALSAGTEGRHGVLVPRDHFDAIFRHAPLTVTDEPDDLYANLRVVAVRLDPCFVERGVAEGCPSQVRLVLQPVMATDAGLTTRDAAVHAFYAVARSELRALAQDLLALRPTDAGDTVGLHPDPTAAAALVLASVGEDRLTRVTHMSVHASNEAWVFAGFDIAAGRRESLFVPGGTQTPAHDFRFDQHLTSTGTDGELAATLIPEPAIEPDIAGFLDERRRDSLSADARDTAIQALERLLDPAAHDPGTVDCASCHVASAAMHFAHRTDSTPPSPYDNTKNQRMLGYYFREPTISRRVLAETDLVVDQLNAGPESP